VIPNKGQYPPEWNQLFLDFARPVRRVSLAVSRLPHRSSQNILSRRLGEQIFSRCADFS
jgi:hypothetical protein